MWISSSLLSPSDFYRIQISTHNDILECPYHTTAPHSKAARFLSDKHSFQNPFLIIKHLTLFTSVWLKTELRHLVLKKVASIVKSWNVWRRSPRTQCTSPRKTTENEMFTFISWVVLFQVVDWLQAACIVPLSHRRIDYLSRLHTHFSFWPLNWNVWQKVPIGRSRQQREHLHFLENFGISEFGFPRRLSSKWKPRDLKFFMKQTLILR